MLLGKTISQREKERENMYSLCPHLSKRETKGGHVQSLSPPLKERKKGGHVQSLSPPLKERKKGGYVQSLSPPLKDRKKGGHVQSLSPPLKERKKGGHVPSLSRPLKERNKGRTCTVFVPTSQREKEREDMYSLCPHLSLRERGNIAFFSSVEFIYPKP